MTRNADRRYRRLGSAVGALMLAAGALSPCEAWASVNPGRPKGAAHPSRHVVVNPDWIKRPDGEAFAAYFPKLAQMIELEGLARIRCTVTALGALEDCQVRHEAPIGMGFGEAGLKLTPYFRMRPKAVDGQEVAGGSVTIPIRFKLAESEGEKVEKASLTTPAPAIAPLPPNDVSLRIAQALLGGGHFATVAEQGRAQIIRQLAYEDQPIMTQQQKAALDIYIDVQKARERNAIEVAAAAYRKTYTPETLAQIAVLMEMPVWKTWRERLPSVDREITALSADREDGVREEPARLFCLKFACAADADTSPSDEE